VSADLEAVRADAQVGREGVLVPLATESGTAELRVPPAGRWKTRATRSLKQGDFDAWAEAVLSPEDYDAWVDADPTNDDVEQFFKAWNEASGEDSGKSAASQRSSRSTARR
jgi:hypothetical protein